MLCLLLIAIAADEAIPKNVDFFFRREAQMKYNAIVTEERMHAGAMNPKNGKKPGLKKAKELEKQHEERMKAIREKKYRPELKPDGLKDGAIGYFDYNIRVLQIQDESSMLAKFSDDLVLLKGVSTKGVADDESVKYEKLLTVSGTASYTSVGGGKRTVMVVKTIDQMEVEKYRAVWNEQNREPEPEEKPKSLPKPMSRDEVAASKLELAKDLMEKNPAAAKKRLQEIIDKYPQTEAAKEAADLLGK